MDTQRIQKLEEWKSKMDKALSTPTKYPLPSSRLGIHLIPVGIESHKDYIRKLKPSVIKIVNGNQQDILLAQQNIEPGGVIVLRDHARSEQQDFLARDPIGCGKQHALEWKRDFDQGGKYFGLDRTKFVVCGLNEPFVRGPEEEKKLLDYTIAFLMALKSYGMRGMCLNLSVGWPRNNGANTPPIWDTFLPLEKVINEGNHILGLHEYWYDDPDEGWTEYNGIKFGWRAFRHLYCPLQVPIIIGECGLTKAVDLVRWNNDGRPPKGWIGNKTPDQYAEQLWRYARKCSPNVIGVMPFTTGFASQDWAEDATDTAHPYIIDRKEPYTFPPNFPIKPNQTEEEPVMNKIAIFPFTGAEDKITQYFADPRYADNYAKFGLKAHNGLDFSCPVGTDVLSVADGEVMFVDVDVSYGNYVRIYHPSLNMCSFYAHLNKPLVKRGDKVKQGQKIAESGNTGNSTAPHLHLEFRAMINRSYYDNKVNIGYGSKGQIDPYPILILPSQG